MTPPSAADPDQVNRVIDSSEFHSAGGAENERVGPMSGIYHNQKVKIKIKNGEGGGCMASDGPRLNKAPKKSAVAPTSNNLGAGPRRQISAPAALAEPVAGRQFRRGAGGRVSG